MSSTVNGGGRGKPRVPVFHIFLGLLYTLSLLGVAFLLARRRVLLHHAARGTGAPPGLLDLEGRGFGGAAPGCRGRLHDDGAPPLFGAQAGAAPSSPRGPVALARRPHLPRGRGPPAHRPSHRLQGRRARGPQLLVDDGGRPLGGRGPLPLPPDSPDPRRGGAEPRPKSRPSINRSPSSCAATSGSPRRPCSA